MLLTGRLYRSQPVLFFVKKVKIMADTVQIRYSAELSYINENKEETIIDSAKITSIMIDYDYEKNNMPILMLNLKIEKNLLDEIIINAVNNTLPKPPMIFSNTAIGALAS